MHHQAQTLSDCAALAHGFFTRKGGVSEGIYASLNCGPGSEDASDNIVENRRRVAETLGAESLCSLYQIHSAEVIAVNEPFTEKPQADAMVTNQPCIALGILTADCGPVLFADPESRVIGAAHAGWKGAFSGILENTIAEMEALGARRQHITAVLGPTISQASYQVDAAFCERFSQQDKDNERFFSPSLPAERFDAFAMQPPQAISHYQFDLPGYILHRLNNSGLAKAEALAMDTYNNEAEFFSYRRTTHLGEPDYGRQISAIMLKET